jgi:hypothetical protein
VGRQQRRQQPEHVGAAGAQLAGGRHHGAPAGQRGLDVVGGCRRPVGGAEEGRGRGRRPVVGDQASRGARHLALDLVDRQRGRERARRLVQQRELAEPLLAHLQGPVLALIGGRVGDGQPAQVGQQRQVAEPFRRRPLGAAAGGQDAERLVGHGHRDERDGAHAGLGELPAGRPGGHLADPELDRPARLQDIAHVAAQRALERLAGGAGRGHERRLGARRRAATQHQRQPGLGAGGRRDPGRGAGQLVQRRLRLQRGDQPPRHLLHLVELRLQPPLVAVPPPERRRQRGRPQHPRVDRAEAARPHRVEGRQHPEGGGAQPPADEQPVARHRQPERCLVVLARAAHGQVVEDDAVERPAGAGPAGERGQGPERRGVEAVGARLGVQRAALQAPEDHQAGAHLGGDRGGQPGGVAVRELLGDGLQRGGRTHERADVAFARRGGSAARPSPVPGGHRTSFSLTHSEADTMRADLVDISLPGNRAMGEVRPAAGTERTTSGPPVVRRARLTYVR